MTYKQVRGYWIRLQNDVRGTREELLLEGLGNTIWLLERAGVPAGHIVGVIHRCEDYWDGNPDEAPKDNARIIEELIHSLVISVRLEQGE